MCWQHVYEKGVLFLIIISGCLLPIRLLTSPMKQLVSIRSQTIAMAMVWLRMLTSCFMGEVNNLIGRRHPLMMIKKRTPFSYTCCQHMSDDDHFFLESRTCVNTRPDNT